MEEKRKWNNMELTTERIRMKRLESLGYLADLDSIKFAFVFNCN